MSTPTVGQPYAVNDGPEIIIPTYVRESEAPRSNGACRTHDFTDNAPINPVGWYVEFHYPDDHIGYTKFIPFPAKETA